MSVRDCSAFTGPPNFTAFSPFSDEQGQGGGRRLFRSPFRRASHKGSPKVAVPPGPPREGASGFDVADALKDEIV